MRPGSYPVCRRALMWAVMVIFGGCSMNEAPSHVAATGATPTQVMTLSDGSAQVVSSGDEPAQLILLAGPTADWFLDLDPPPPPDGRVVVAGNDAGAVFAFVLGRDMNDAEDQLGKLKISHAVEGCDLDGTTCCDVESKTYVIDAGSESEHFWLSLGERCEGLPPEARFAEGAPVGETNASFVELEPEIISALAAYGATYPFMTLAEQTGAGRVLFDPSYEVTELGLAPPAVKRPGVDERSTIVPAGHVASGHPRCVSGIDSCKSEDGDRCNAGRLHWFRWNDSKEKWCQMADRCRC